MDKLLAIVEKLKSEIVPDQPVGKMSKPDLLSFLEGAKMVERMKVFHQKGEKGLRSAITDDEDDVQEVMDRIARQADDVLRASGRLQT